MGKKISGSIKAQRTITDIIVHIFDKQNRLFYDLERIWRDGKEINAEEFDSLK